MAGREQFSVGLQKSPTQPQQSAPQMRLAFTPDGIAVYKPVVESSPTYQTAAGAGGAAGGSRDNAVLRVVFAKDIYKSSIDVLSKICRARGSQHALALAD